MLFIDLLGDYSMELFFNACGYRFFPHVDVTIYRDLII